MSRYCSQSRPSRSAILRAGNGIPPPRGPLPRAGACDADGQTVRSRRAGRDRQSATSSITRPCCSTTRSATSPSLSSQSCPCGRTLRPDVGGRWPPRGHAAACRPAPICTRARSGRRSRTTPTSCNTSSCRHELRRFELKLVTPRRHAFMAVSARARTALARACSVTDADDRRGRAKPSWAGCERAANGKFRAVESRVRASTA